MESLVNDLATITTIPVNSLQKLKENAEYDDRSLSQYINLVLKQYLNNEKSKTWTKSCFFIIIATHLL